jgi:arginyl-tRNA synthetase
MKKTIPDLLIPILKQAIKDLNFVLPPEYDLSIELSGDTAFGDLSTNIALRLASRLKKSPQDIAASVVSSIKRNLSKGILRDYVKEIKIEGAGFINFYLHNKYFYEQLQEIIKKGKNFAKSTPIKKEKVLIEFVSANPTGPLSVAHARQAVVGDVLANILEYLGFFVKREYYLNDEGNQINILGRSLELRLKELLGEKIEFPEDYYQGEYVCDIARKVKSQKSKVKSFSDYAIRYILNIIKKELADFRVRFDYWYSQKELRKSGKINKVLTFLKHRGFLYEQDGALWLKSSQFQDDKDRVVIKSDGTYTYLAPDIAYHKDKFKRGFSRLINLWGPDHHGYINRLKAAVKALGKDPDSLSIIIVQLASIFKDGKPLQMSTRRGQYITLREVLDEVGIDAARFFFLMRRTSSHLDFDLTLAKKQTPENPVYYVQYAYARICSILRNSKIKNKPAEVNFTLLREQEEMGLIKKLWRFPYMLNICLHTLDPYMVTVYLGELAESFHKFYDKHRVLDQIEDLTKARIALIKATKIVIALGLELSGISKPETM